MTNKQIAMRLGQMVLVLLGISFITFCLVMLAPGDPVRQMIAGNEDIVVSQVEDEKPYLLTALTVKYMPNVKSDIVLTVNNILDRDDNINHGSSHYSTVPTNFLLTYNYRL